MTTTTKTTIHPELTAAILDAVADIPGHTSRTASDLSVKVTSAMRRLAQAGVVEEVDVMTRNNNHGSPFYEVTGSTISKVLAALADPRVIIRKGGNGYRLYSWAPAVEAEAARVEARRAAADRVTVADYGTAIVVLLDSDQVASFQTRVLAPVQTYETAMEMAQAAASVLRKSLAQEAAAR